MDYALSEQQQAFRVAAERFAKQKLAPHYQKRAKQDRIDRALLKEMGGLGLIGVDLPEKYGGLGESSATSGVIIEQIAYGDFNASYVQLLASLMGGMVAQHASPDIAQEWLPRVTRGDAIIGLGLDRAARRFRRGQPHPARREVRQRLPSQRRKDVDELLGPVRRRGHLRAHRQDRGRRTRRQRVLCRSQPKGDHPHAFRRHRHQAGRPGLGVLRRRLHPGRMPDGRGEQGLFQDHVRLRLQPRPDRPRMHRTGPGLGR